MYIHAVVRYLIDPLLDFRNPSNMGNDNEHNSGTHNSKYEYNEPSLERIRRNSKLVAACINGGYAAKRDSS